MARRTLPAADAAKLLRHVSRLSRRDECILALALTGGLRVAELSALNVNDVWDFKRRCARWRIVLPVSKRRIDYDGDVLLPEQTTRRLTRYIRLGLLPSPHIRAALFRTQHGPGGYEDGGRRLGVQGMQRMWKRYQLELRWVDGRGKPVYTFHDLRATAITESLRKTGNLELARRFARHANARTTSGYVHMSADEVRNAAPEY